MLCVNMTPIYTKSGMSISIQASAGHYSTPREDDAITYTHVELGYPTRVPPDYILEYAETVEEPMESVYAYVPTELVERWLAEEGGIDVGRTIAAHNARVLNKALVNVG